MRDLMDAELDLIHGGSESSAGRRTWTFTGDTITIVESGEALSDLRKSALTGALGGAPDPRRMVVGALAGGFVSMFTISDHTRSVRPVVTIHEVKGSQRGAP